MFSCRPISCSLNLMVCNKAIFISSSHRFCSHRRHCLCATICWPVHYFSMLHILGSLNCLESYVLCSRFAWNTDGPFQPKQLSTCARWLIKECMSFLPLWLAHWIYILLPRWASMTSLQQFKGVPAKVTWKTKGKQFLSNNLVCWNISWCLQPQ